MKTITFFVIIFFSISANAQYKRIVLVNKKNHLKDIFRLPHYANLNLVGDLPEYKSRVMIDSVNSETLFVSNPTNKSQQLIIPIKEVVSIHIPHRGIIEPIRIFVGAYCSIGFLAIFSASPNDGPNKNESAKIAAATLLAGTAFSLFFSGPVRIYNTNNYEIKNTYK
ncbi:MAG: hypothetical protein ACOYMA_02520 [Bacteroidia bacterium]